MGTDWITACIPDFEFIFEGNDHNDVIESADHQDVNALTKVVADDLLISRSSLEL